MSENMSQEERPPYNPYPYDLKPYPADVTVMAKALAALGNDSVEMRLLKVILIRFFEYQYDLEWKECNGIWWINIPGNKGFTPHVNPDYPNQPTFTSHSFTDCVLWVLNEYSKAVRDE